MAVREVGVGQNLQPRQCHSKCLLAIVSLGETGRNWPIGTPSDELSTKKTTNRGWATDSSQSHFGSCVRLTYHRHRSGSRGRRARCRAQLQSRVAVY